MHMAHIFLRLPNCRAVYTFLTSSTQGCLFEAYPDGRTGWTTDVSCDGPKSECGVHAARLTVSRLNSSSSIFQSVGAAAGQSASPCNSGRRCGSFLKAVTPLPQRCDVPTAIVSVSSSIASCRIRCSNGCAAIRRIPRTMRTNQTARWPKRQVRQNLSPKASALTPPLPSPSAPCWIPTGSSLAREWHSPSLPKPPVHQAPRSSSPRHATG